MNDSQVETVEVIAQKISAEIDHRERQPHIIQALLSKRQGVLVAMCDLAELELEEASSPAILASLKIFNQALVDYSALGHFEIYERIVDGKEQRANVEKVASTVYSVISATTEKFVEFNDKYDGADDEESITNLFTDLSPIAESMADRIESEDRLLQQMSSTALKIPS